MTDDEIEVFLNLKFGDMPKVLAAFDKATGAPADAHGDVITKVLKMWVEQGAPNKIHIPDDKVELFLELKYGSVADAYHHWVETRPGAEHNLTDAELHVVMDFIDV